MTANEYKHFKGLKKENLRDNMTNVELALNALAEASATEISKDRNPEGFHENVQVAHEGGKVARAAREQLEQTLRRSAISPMNAKKGILLNKASNDNKKEDEQ